MSKNKTWAPPGWPWELDALSFVFVIAALAIPYVLFGQSSGDEVTLTLREQHHVLWAIGIFVLFVIQLAIGGGTLEMISTPFLHLIAPTVFAVIAYFRIHTVLEETGIKTWVSGSALQYILFAIGALALTLIIARIRTLRFLRKFRDFHWEISQKAPYDKTYWSLIAEFEPLVYPPRAYRACNEGILIEGWFYMMAIPFEMFQSLTPAAGMRHASSGRYLASSTRNMIRIELLDNAQPLYISPANRSEFIAYCASHFARIRAHGSTAKGTHAGTTRGTHTGATARGSSKGTFYGQRTEHGTRAS